MRLILVLPLLAAAVRLDSLSLTLLLACSITAGILRVSFGLRPVPWIALLFGALVPVLPMFSVDLLLYAGLAFCGLMARRSSISLNTLWCLPLLALLFIWSIAHGVAVFDPHTFSQMIQMAGADPLAWRNEMSLAFGASLPVLLTALESTFRILLLAALFNVFSADEVLREKFERGLVFGILAAGAVSLGQILGFYPQAFTNQSAFWTSLGRFSGTFSDPNAFGIFAVLALAVLAHAGRAARGWYKSVTAGTFLLLAAIAPFSGSRSFFAGLVIYVFYFVLRRSRRGAGGIVLLLLASIAALNILKMDESLFPLVYGQFPIGLQRVADSVIFSTAGQAWYSRTVFYQLGFSVWVDNWLIGAGLGTFRSLVVPYSQALGFDTGLWSDNANNYYLGILAETGIVGLLALAASIARLKWNPDAGNLWRAPVVVMAVLLLLGPHLDFNEITILFAFILSRACQLRCSTARFRVWPIAVPALAAASLIFLSAWFGEHGLYAWERSPAGEYYRWSGRSAQVVLPCGKKHSASLKIAAPLPSQILPAKVMVESQFGESIEVLFEKSAGAVREVSMACFGGASVPAGGLAAHSLVVRVTTDKPWIPGRHGVGDDSRELGVQIFTSLSASKP